MAIFLLVSAGVFSFVGCLLVPLVFVGLLSADLMEGFGFDETTHVSYQQLLNGQPSRVIEAQAGDRPVAFQLLRIRETSATPAPAAAQPLAPRQRRVVVTIDVRSDSIYPLGLSARLGFHDGVGYPSVDATEFFVEGPPVEDVVIHPGALEVGAVFLVPESARRTYLGLELEGHGSLPWQGVKFVFD